MHPILSDLRSYAGLGLVSTWMGVSVFWAGLGICHTCCLASVMCSFGPQISNQHVAYILWNDFLWIILMVFFKKLCWHFVYRAVEPIPWPGIWLYKEILFSFLPPAVFLGSVLHYGPVFLFDMWYGKTSYFPLVFWSFRLVLVNIGSYISKPFLLLFKN